MKLVSESLNELYNFEKKSDPLVSLGVGKKALITRWLDDMGITDYIINNDYSIDVEGNVNLYNRGLDKFPDYIKFGSVGGWFDCSNNQLVSLEGCPKIVTKTFFCSRNKLKSLEGCPISVECFWCTDNKGIKFKKQDILKLCKVLNLHNNIIPINLS